MKDIGLELQWVRNKIDALNNNQYNWDTTEWVEEQDKSESEFSDNDKTEEDTTQVREKELELKS